MVSKTIDSVKIVWVSSPTNFGGSFHVASSVLLDQLYPDLAYDCKNSYI